jgi:predicted  nucleic acid-binding Zn-ribbon protein
MTEEDKQRIEYLYHARPHTKEQGEEILKLYRQYIDPGLTSGCSKCGGPIFNYLKRLVEKAKININNNKSK